MKKRYKQGAAVERGRDAMPQAVPMGRNKCCPNLVALAFLLLLCMFHRLYLAYVGLKEQSPGIGL